MRIERKRANFQGSRISYILPAIFWFLLLALVLAETLVVGFSTSHTTNSATRQEDDSPAMVDGPWSSAVGTNLPAAASAQDL
jgi:hypothetical protein